MSAQFHQLLLNQLPRLRAYAVFLTGTRADADDLLQETSLLALRHERSFEIGTNFSAWTYRIMRNSFLTSRRRAKHRTVSIDEVPEEALLRDETQEDSVLAGEILRGMQNLNIHSREVLALICGGDMSYQEAADALSCSIGTVKSRLFRAREQMKEFLEGANDDTPPAPRRAEASALHAVRH